MHTTEPSIVSSHFQTGFIYNLSDFAGVKTTSFDERKDITDDSKGKLVIPEEKCAIPAKAIEIATLAGILIQIVIAATACYYNRKHVKSR